MRIIYEWLHDLHQVTGGITLCRQRPDVKDFDEWIATLQRVAEEMRGERDKIIGQV